MHRAQDGREKHLATSRVSPSLLPCSSRFLRALQQNKGQSRCLFVKQITSNFLKVARSHATLHTPTTQEDTAVSAHKAEEDYVIML